MMFFQFFIFFHTGHLDTFRIPHVDPGAAGTSWNMGYRHSTKADLD